MTRSPKLPWSQINCRLLDLLGAVLLKIGLGAQAEVGGLDLILPDLLGPEVGLFPILLGGSGSLRASPWRPLILFS